MALTRAEINKLFDLLRDLHGKDKPRDERTVAIWSAVLEPWDYRQVRTAAVERARENRFPPDPGELAEYLPRIPRKTAAGATAPQATGCADEKARAWQESAYATWREARDKLTPKRQAAGVPTSLAEAERVGLTPTAWWRILEKHGLQTPMGAFAGTDDTTGGRTVCG